MAFDVFVSYSHEDAPLVSPVVRLLRATHRKGTTFAFQDRDSIQPGERWREAIGEAIAGARQVIVFWCCHSHASQEVQREYEAALAARRSLMPVLLDSTVLPSVMGDFQWIDFRSLVSHEARGSASPRPAAAAAVGFRKPVYLVPLLTVVTIAMAGLLVVASWRQQPVGPSPPGPIAESTRDPSLVTTTPATTSTPLPTPATTTPANVESTSLPPPVTMPTPVAESRPLPTPATISTPVVESTPLPPPVTMPTPVAESTPGPTPTARPEPPPPTWVAESPAAALGFTLVFAVLLLAGAWPSVFVLLKLRDRRRRQRAMAEALLQELRRRTVE